MSLKGDIVIVFKHEKMFLLQFSELDITRQDFLGNCDRIIEMRKRTETSKIWW